ncbi:cytochrome c [Chloroflexales bacterium ZM16-3]|nr:cytochrome c [Chloroflexales bacterium ZM16-3]
MQKIIFILMLLTLAACGAAAAPPDPVAAGGRVFTIQCGGCHAISDIGSAALGPRLDAMVARANATTDPAAWLRLSITQPAAEISPGYRPGLMPISYGQGLRPDEIDALVAYMLKVGG